MCDLEKGKTHMNTKLLSLASAVALASTVAQADDFDNATASMTAEFGQFEFTLEGTENNGYSELSLGATVLEYGISESVNSEVGVFATHYDGADAYGLGADYTLTYRDRAFSAWGVAELEYIGATGDFDNGDVFVTPTVGAGYDVTDTVTVWSEVGYTWAATDDWNRSGGEFELGADFSLADNVTFTPSIVRDFDSAADETQLNLGVNLSF
jgi:opacity protein-like surface antigen